MDQLHSSLILYVHYSARQSHPVSEQPVQYEQYLEYANFSNSDNFSFSTTDKSWDLAFSIRYSLAGLSTLSFNCFNASTPIKVKPNAPAFSAKWDSFGYVLSRASPHNPCSL